MNELRTGYIPDEKDERDLVFGAEQSLAAKFAGRTILNEEGDWSKYLPITELQSPKFETNSCVAHGTLSAVEMLFVCQYGEKPNFSDRFLAKISDTDPASGNSPRKVANAFKKGWCAWEEEWPRFVDTLEEWYTEIPQKLKTLAIGRGARYEFGYEKVRYSDLREALKYSPIGISVPAWWLGDDNRYYRPEGQWDTHWTVCYAMQPNGDLLVFDSYAPFLKTIKADVVPRTLFSYYIKVQIKDENLWTKFLDWLTLSLAGFKQNLGIS